MKFNQLPEGYNKSKLGPQKRQTEFDSEEAKLAYDAGNLIAKARKSLQVSGVEVNSRSQILIATQIIVGAHRKDCNEALLQAINTELNKEEQEARLKQSLSHEGSRSQYESFIDNLKLSETDTAKLKEMMSEANYVNAIETAREMEASRIPTYKQITKKLMTFTPEKLKDICEIMERPKLQIVSDQRFDENIKAMDANKHYTSADGQPQENTYVYNRGSSSPYRNPKKPAKVRVKISDGVVHPKQLTEVSIRLGERRKHLTAKFKAKGMSHIDQNAMATLIQQSLREAKTANDNSLIVDNWKDSDGTVTFIDPRSLTVSARVAYAFFDSDSRRACFISRRRHTKNVHNSHARGRASMQILEI